MKPADMEVEGDDPASNQDQDLSQKEEEEETVKKSSKKKSSKTKVPSKKKKLNEEGNFFINSLGLLTLFT